MASSRLVIWRILLEVLVCPNVQAVVEQESAAGAVVKARTMTIRPAKFAREQDDVRIRLRLDIIAMVPGRSQK